MSDFIKISPSACINTDSISYICEYAGKPVLTNIKELKEKNKVLNLTTGKKIGSVIYLKAGEYKAILSPVSITTLIKRLGEGDS